MKTKPATDIAPPETYHTAKRLFATHARLFDIVDNSQESCYRDGVWSDTLFREQAHRFHEKIRHAKQDFWIYETDLLNIKTAVSRVAVKYTEQRGPATDVQSASPAKLRYINQRARKAGLAIADYVKDRRPLLYQRVDAETTGFCFSIHAMKRFWQRNESGAGACAFDDISMDHIVPAFCKNKDRADQILTRTDLMVPYLGGAFIGSAVWKPKSSYYCENNGELCTAELSQMPLDDLQVGFNAITYIGEHTMSSFQRIMCDAIKAGDHARYHKLFEQDFKKSAISHSLTS